MDESRQKRESQKKVWADSYPPILFEIQPEKTKFKPVKCWVKGWFLKYLAEKNNYLGEIFYFLAKLLNFLGDKIQFQGLNTGLLGENLIFLT